MDRKRNLADPAFEPSDDDLAELTRSAFAHVHEQEVQRLAKLRADVARERQDVLARLRAAVP